jgi:DnaJ like chaperone protein
MQFLFFLIIVVSVGAYQTAAKEWGAGAGVLSILVAITLPCLSLYLWSLWSGEEDKNNNEQSGAQRRSGNTTSSQDDVFTRHQSAYLRLLSAMMAKIAKADGQIDASEIRMAEGAFAKLGFSEVQRQLCILAFRNALNESHNIYYYATEMVNLGFSYEMRVVAYEILWDIACADGILAPAEKNVLEALERELMLGPGTFARLFRQRIRRTNKWDYDDQNENAHQYRDSLENEYAELGCKSSATDEELRKAYRSLAKKLHPDILRAQGMPESLMRKSNARMARINTAWDKIKKARGIKN